MNESDSRQRFLLERTQVRGELVSLDATLRAVLERHPYPPAVAGLLGEALAAAALLASTIKFEGALTLQVQGGAPVSLLLAQCTSQGGLRGLARWHGEAPAEMPPRWLGDATLTLTIDQPRTGERYQGIVAVAGGDLSAALESYFRQSEQLPTRVWLASNESRAAGLLLQRLPGTEEDADAWDRAAQLAETLTRGELLELPGSEVRRRLFQEEDVRVFEPEPVSFRCGCSRERVAETLVSLGREELRSILADEGRVEVHCEFCNHGYHFDAVDVEALFAGTQAEAPTTKQ